MYRTKRRILRSLVLSFAVAAFAAPAALGEPRGAGNTDSPILNTVQQAPSPDDRGLYRGTAPLNQSLSADDRSLYRGTSVEQDPQIVAIRVTSPDDRSLFRGVETVNEPVSVTFSSPSDGFEWADAGLGAASTLALVLLMGAGTLMIRHQRRRIAAF